MRTSSRPREKLDIPGIEIIPDQMIPGYPNISDEFLKQWHGWMEKYGRTPVCIDMFLDWNKFKGRVMTEDERVESIALDIVNANKLGCGVIRVIHDVEPAILERLAPTAEKYGVKLALEIHAPSYYDSELEQRLIAMFQRVAVALSLFHARPGRVRQASAAGDHRTLSARRHEEGDCRVRSPKPTRAASLRLSDGPGAAEQMIGKIVAMGGTEQDIYLAMMGAHMIYRDPRTMLEYLPYTSHIHGKFYEMLPGLHRVQHPLRGDHPGADGGRLRRLHQQRVRGQRWIQDAFEVDSTEQVRRHHVMLKRLLGEE